MNSSNFKFSKAFDLRRRFFHSQFGRDIVINTIVLSLSKSIGFVVPIVISRAFGLNWQTDVFFYVYALLMFFTMGIATTIEAVLVPSLVSKGKSEQNLLVSQLFIWSSFILLVSSITIGAFLVPLVGLTTKFSETQLTLLIKLAISILPTLFIIVYNSISSAYLSSSGKFSIVSISATIRAAGIVVLLMVMIPNWGIFAIPFSFLGGEILKFTVGYYFIQKRLKFSFTFRARPDGGLREFYRTAVFQFFSVTIIALSPFIDRALAALLEEGSLTMIEYAEKLYLIPVTIITIGTSLVVLPRWSRAFELDDKSHLLKEIIRFVLVLFLFGVIIVAPMIYFSDSLVGFLFGARLSVAQIETIGLNTILYLLGVPFYVVCVILIRALLATKDTKVLMKISGVRLLLKISINIGLVLVFGIYGIPLSSSINSVLLLAILSFVLWRKLTARKNHTPFYPNP